uniref:Uncharacterized protein n=1 Tax=Triticum urartu TaxID=4572 RepID=A0A8R7V5V4_TRIUA
MCVRRALRRPAVGVSSRRRIMVPHLSTTHIKILCVSEEPSDAQPSVSLPEEGSWFPTSLQLILKFWYILFLLYSKRARALQRGNKIMFRHLSQLLHLVIVINLFILLPFWKFPFALLQLLLCTRPCGFHHHTEQMPVRKER